MLGATSTLPSTLRARYPFGSGTVSVRIISEGITGFPFSESLSSTFNTFKAPSSPLIPEALSSFATIGAAVTGTVTIA